jgi:hypothetical protein
VGVAGPIVFVGKSDGEKAVTFTNKHDGEEKIDILNLS